ncbi:MAG: efflux transporter periplasmic adaptor subunit [Rhizobiales bacterium 62-17]|nr:efflux RND transporter periplasmic adaptor subunit [Hyphomicrobiales bacterium]OJY01245.1 MAG: efflux transporter periplasmic adaptor subunit [Rhizobiales bacterium 62-17]
MVHFSKLRGRLGRPQMVIAIAAVCLVSTTALFSWRVSGVQRASAAVGNSKNENGLFQPTQAQWAALSVEPVKAVSFRSEFSTEGKIAIDEDRATRIYSQYGGRVLQLAVGTGDKVRKGQLLLTIEAADSIETQKDFVSALGDLNKARSQVNLMTIAERRLNRLYRDKAMALKDLEEAQANLTAAQNDVRTAEIALQAVRNRLRLLGKTDEEIHAFENTGTITPAAPVYSPIMGTVLQRHIGPGQYIDAGASSAEPAFLIGDVSKVWLVAYVREADADRVRVNQPLSFTVLTLPNETFDARVSYVASSLDPTSRRLLVRASVDNPHGRLKPEMFAHARIVTDETGNSPAVPRDAVIYEGDAARIWVARNDGAIELRHVKLGLANGDLIQVTNGIAVDEKVITRGSLFIDRAASLGS